MKKSIIKRLFVLILTLCLIAGSISVYAEADDLGLIPPTEVLKEYVDVDELREYLFNSFKECNDERIELAQYNLPLSASDALKNFIWREMPECFHVDKLRMNNNGTIITAIRSGGYKFIETKEQYLSMLAECEAKAAELLKGIAGNDSLSDAEKVLLIHDRLAVNCNYKNDAAVVERYTMYGALVRGVAVCDGYSRAYAYLLRRVGIETINCSSDKLNHAWNLVKIDGTYYHVDVTWDDPMCLNNSKSFIGYVQHNYVLLSDKEIKARKHDANDYYNTMAPSTKYDDYFWRCSETSFQLAGGQIYYFDTKNAELMRLNEDRISGTALWSVPDRWWAPDRTYFWEGNYTRLASDGRSLFFSSPDAVFIYSLKTETARVLFRPELKNGDVIYGLAYSDGYIIVESNDRPSGSDARLKKNSYQYIPDEDTELPPEKISAALTSTADLQNNQTVTAVITSDTGISGYYFGKDAEFSEADIKKSSEATITFKVREAGTYYFVAYDGTGVSCEPVTMTFCMITLYLRGGELPANRILTEKNNTFSLPVPVKEGMTFVGWTETQNAHFGAIDYTISDPPMNMDVYATWISENEIVSSVSVRENTAVTLTLKDAEGNPIDAAVSDKGELLISKAEGTAFVEVTAPGYVGRIYRADDFPGTGEEIVLDLLGDMDKDNELNNKDVTGLFRNLSKTGEDYNDVADVNGDMQNNNKDVVFLFRCLSDPTVFLITHSKLMY